VNCGFDLWRGEGSKRAVTRSSEEESAVVDLRTVEAPVDMREFSVPAQIWDRLVDDGDVNDPELVRLIRDRFRPRAVAAGAAPSGSPADARAGGVATAARPATQDDAVRLKVEALTQLAAGLQADGRHGEAEALLRRGLVLAEVTYGPEADEVAGLRLVLAAALVAQDKVEEAQPHLDRVVSRLDAVALDPSSVASAYQLAKFLAGRGKVDQAIALYEHTVAIRRDALGPDHPEVAITLHNLALLYNAAGRVEEANSVWAEARALLDG
jgi:tetratricopeptide (TPR) repeat protein